MKNKLVIIGAGGHGKVVLDLAIKNCYKDISFIDDNKVGELFSVPIISNNSKIIAVVVQNILLWSIRRYTSASQGIEKKYQFILLAKRRYNYA